ADADARGLREEDALHRHLEEIALDLARQTIARPRARLATDLHAEHLAEVAAQRRWDDVERRLVQRRPGERVHRPLVRVAVFLDASLEQDRHRRLAAPRRGEQQQQATADIGARRGALEIVD